MKTTTKRRRFAGLPDVPTTRVCIVDDLLGTRREFSVPCEAEEAVKSVHDLELALYFCDRLSLFADAEDMSLGVSLHRSRNRVAVRWFAVDGDVERALEERGDETDELFGRACR